MDTSDLIALIAVVVAVASAVLHLWLRHADMQESRRTSIMTALQGEKEAVGYEAYRIGQRGWPKGQHERAQLRDALCLAFIFESSDRTRAMIYRALKNYPSADHQQLGETLNILRQIFDGAEQASADLDLKRGWTRLAALGMMLNFPEVAEVAQNRLKSPADLPRN